MTNTVKIIAVVPRIVKIRLIFFLLTTSFPSFHISIACSFRHLKHTIDEQAVCLYEIIDFLWNGK